MAAVKPTVTTLISSRLRLPSLIVAVVVVATAAYMFREWAVLRDARQQFDYAWTNWQDSQASSENIVLRSRRLMDTEAATLWISTHAAQQHHVERMQRLIECVDSAAPESLPPDAQRQAELVRREIAELKPADK